MLGFWESRVFCPVMDSEGFFYNERNVRLYIIIIFGSVWTC